MAAMSYEEARKERLEENKRRMEELGLMSLAKDLKKPRIVRKPAVPKPKIELQEARRSSRVAAKPVVIYRDVARKLSSGGAKNSQEARERRERLALRRRYLTEAARKVAIEAAEEVFKSIENPAFVKPMQHSRLSTVSWLALPAEFCKEHLPLSDEKVMLEDEKEKSWECHFIATKTGIGSGWRGFATDHDLMDGDCCIFELVGPLHFKVHIVRFVDDEEEEDESDEEEDEDESDDSDDGDRKKSRAKKSRRSSSAKKKTSEDEDAEDEVDEDEEDDDEEEEFDSDVCDDHVSEEEEEEADDEDDSEDDYSPRLSEKEVDTLVAAPSRASRGLKRKLGKEDDDDDKVDDELGFAEDLNEIKHEDP